MRFNTLYHNGRFDVIQKEHVGPNKVGAKRSLDLTECARNGMPCVLALA